MILLGKDDIFKGVTVKTGYLEPSVRENFEVHLLESLAHWKENHRRGIWIQVRLEDSDLVPILARNGFVFHHAQTNYVMMTIWLPKNRPNTLPRYAHTNIGVGGLVEDAEGRILMMRERKASHAYHGWKFPGGLSDPGEDLLETAAREVKEETGVESQGQSIIMFRQTSKTRFANIGDIYFVASMKLVDEAKKEITPCPHETEEARWFSREEIDKLDEHELHGFIRQILERFEKWKASGRKGLHKVSIDSIVGSVFIIDE